MKLKRKANISQAYMYNNMSLNSEPVLFKRNYEMLKKHVILNVWRTFLKWQESFDVLIYFSISIQFKVDVLDWTHYRHWFREKTMRTGRMNSTFRRRTAHVLHSSFNQNIRRRLYPMLYNESFRLQRRHYFLAFIKNRCPLAYREYTTRQHTDVGPVGQESRDRNKPTDATLSWSFL